jgi:hypothetical protein
MKRFLKHATVVVTAVSTSVGGLVAATTGIAAAAMPRTALSVAGVEIDLKRSANFGRPVPGLKSSVAIDRLAVSPTLIVHLPSDLDGAAGADASGVVLNGPTADGKFVQVVASAHGFGFVTKQHAVIEERLPVQMTPGSSMRTSPDGSLEQVAEDGTVMAVIAPAFAVDELGYTMPASYRFDPVTSSLVVRADTTRAHGATFIDPKWGCFYALAVLLGWRFAGLVATWVAGAILTGGWWAVAGFLVMQGALSAQVLGIYYACR